MKGNRYNMNIKSESPPSCPSLPDVHVVAKNMSTETLERLLAIGFGVKEVVGGDDRIKMKYLLSLKSENLEISDKIYEKSFRICDADEEFYGYIEQEIVSSDIRLTYSDTVISRLPDMKFEVSPCPYNLYKGCDLHFAVTDVPQSLLDLAKKYDFYHLVLRKPGLGDVTIFTMQLESPVHGFELWKVMLEFLEGIPNIDCSAKFEVTRNLKRFGDYPLPPLILKDSRPNFVAV
jgi:hypothetical protein